MEAYGRKYEEGRRKGGWAGARDEGVTKCVRCHCRDAGLAWVLVAESRQQRYRGPEPGDQRPILMIDIFLGDKSAFLLVTAGLKYVTDNK